MAPAGGPGAWELLVTVSSVLVAGWKRPGRADRDRTVPDSR